MELFKKRSSAIIVFVVVVIVFTLIGCHRSLGKAVDRVEDTFFERGAFADYGAYTAPGEQLENRVRLSNRLLSVIGGADALAEGYASVAAARQTLSDALDSRDISDIYEADMALTDAVERVDEQVRGGISLPQSYDDYDTIISDLRSAQRAAAESPYNAFVEDFIQNTVREFPTNILRALSFTALPEKYE